jgi:hypothetical protein
MSKRSRLKVGVDVPWVTSWSEEPLTGVRPSPEVGGRLAIGQMEKPGYGRPLYSRNHLRRQRESVVKMLCPMCGKPTAAGDRWTQTGKLVAVGQLRAKGLHAAVPADLADSRIVLDAGAIAPLHRSCAERSRLECPHLQAHATPDLLPFPAVWNVAPLMVEAYRQDQPHFLNPALRPQRSVAVISFLQLCGVTPDEDPAWARAEREQIG